MTALLLRRATPIAVAAAAAGALGALPAACTDVSTSPTHVAALAFDSLPYPAVVAGDTLRDSLGRVAALHALAFNPAGDVIPGAAIRYIALDTGLTIGPDGVVTAQRRDGSVKIVASAGGLQTRAAELRIARRPDTVVAVGKTSDTLFYSFADSPGVNTYASGLKVRVVTGDSAGGVTATQGWLVSYQAFLDGVALPLTDTTRVSLWDDQSHPSGLDTTGADGTAARRLRVRPLGLTAPADSVVVIVAVRYRGAPLSGSPVRFVVHVRPKS